MIRQGAAAKVSLSARDWTALEGDIKSLYPQAYAFFTGKIKTGKSGAPWKLCLLSFFNSDTKVEAFLLGLTDDSAARQCRYRLRKDLGVDGSQSLGVFLQSLD